jgi:ketosteroid isomerase-like protein
MSQESNKAIIKKFYELITQGEDKRAAEFLADDLVWKEVAATRPMTLTNE